MSNIIFAFSKNIFYEQVLQYTKQLISFQHIIYYWTEKLLLDNNMKYFARASNTEFSGFRKKFRSLNPPEWDLFQRPSEVKFLSFHFLPLRLLPLCLCAFFSGDLANPA